MFIVHIHGVYIGLARTIYIRFIYGIFGREITKYTAIYGIYTVLANPMYTRSFLQRYYHECAHMGCTYTAPANPTHVTKL